MKRIGVIIGAALAAVIIAFAYSSYSNAAGNAKEEITALEHKCIAATNTDQAMACYDPKEVVLYDFIPPLEYKGEKAVREDFDNFFKNTSDFKGEFMQLDVVTDGKLGMARSLQHFTWKDKAGKPMEGNFRVTDVLHKVDGQWKMIHTHLSVPVDPATGKAVMDAKE